MSLSAAEDDESPTWEREVVKVRDNVRFSMKRGRLESGDTPETLAKLIFPGKRAKIDVSRTEVIRGAETGQRVVAERKGALFALGPNKAEVATFH